MLSKIVLVFSDFVVAASVRGQVAVTNLYDARMTQDESGLAVVEIINESGIEYKQFLKDVAKAANKVKYEPKGSPKNA